MLVFPIVCLLNPYKMDLLDMYSPLALDAKLSEVISKNKKTIILVFLFLVFMPYVKTPLYWDDEARLTEAYIGFLGLGRIIPQIYYVFFGLSDLHIFNLVISALVTLFIFRFDCVKNNIFVYVALLSNPFFLECFSYRIDIVSMVFAYAVSICASFYECKGTIKMIIVSFSLSLLSILSYQAALNSFATCFIAITILDIINDNKQKIRNMTIRFINLIFISISIKLITLFIELLYSISGREHVNYLGEREKLNISAFYGQLKLFCGLLYSSLNAIQLIILSIMLVIAIVNVVVFLRKNEEKIIIRLFVSVSILLAMFLSVFPYVFLNMPEVISPRIFYGFGGVVLTQGESVNELLN